MGGWTGMCEMGREREDARRTFICAMEFAVSQICTRKTDEYSVNVDYRLLKSKVFSTEYLKLFWSLMLSDFFICSLER